MKTEIEIRHCKTHGETTYVRRSSGWRCRACAVESVDKRRKEVKRRLIEAHGGACIRCGYSKYQGALVFHHRDPETKEFGVGAGTHIGYARMLEESKKCDLLCLNCHQEVHFADKAL